MTVAEMEAFLDRDFPQINNGGKSYHVEEIGPGTCRMRLSYHERHLRPGGTLSGPSMFALADLALYVAVMGALGPMDLAVTTTITINFLRKPAQRDLIAECRLLKIGKRLAVGEVTLYSEGKAEPVAHVTGTYSLPPRS